MQAKTLLTPGDDTLAGRIVAQPVTGAAHMIVSTGSTLRPIDGSRSGQSGASPRTSSLLRSLWASSWTSDLLGQIIQALYRKSAKLRIHNICSKLLNVFVRLRYG